MEKRKTSLRDMKICRFCFHSNEKNLTSIYPKEAKTVPLPVQIMSCVSIEVFPNDGFPQLICNVCRQQTNQSYIFKSNCKKADDALKNFIQSGTLIKPEIIRSFQPNLKSVPVSKVITPLKDVKVVTDVSPSPDSPNIKRRKLDDGTEVITLCISQPENFDSQDDDESSQDSVQEEVTINTIAEQVEENQSEDPLVVPDQVQTDIFPCQYCDRSFPLKQLLELHVTTRHRERQFACPQCDSKFFTKYDMMKHQQTHDNHKPFNCSVCGKVFARLPLLRRHEQTHIEAPKYMCAYCERTFLAKDDLDNHMKKHEKKRPFACETCDKSFVFKQGLERHMNSVHAQDRPHKCNYCDASFNSQIRLTRHITTHAGLRPYPCKICGRTFLLSHHLTRHMRSHYAAEQGRQPEEAVGQHKCDICSMSFKRKDSLINHSAIHSMVNLRCVICNTSFESAKMVKEHITTHLQGLSYACQRCDYSFETPDQLEEHELKHAEMEYEEQIEQEVISEVHQIRNQMTDGSDVEEERFAEEDEVTDYHIPDINNPTIVARAVSSSPVTFHKSTSPGLLEFLPDFRRTSVNPAKKDTTDGLNQIFKTEITDTEGEGDESSIHITGEDEGRRSAELEQEVIRPIFRVEGTKMYQRKGPIQRKIPKVHAEPQNVQTVPLEEINEPLNMGAITQEALSNLPSKKPVNVKVGDKMVKVQKFIISKQEMKHMAKLGEKVLFEWRYRFSPFKQRGTKSVRANPEGQIHKVSLNILLLTRSRLLKTWRCGNFQWAGVNNVCPFRAELRVISSYIDGILELKNGQVTMKNPGQPILNAVIKPVQQSDIESLLNSQKHAMKAPIKQYERRGQSSQNFSENTVEHIIEDFD